MGSQNLKIAFLVWRTVIKFFKWFWQLTPLPPHFCQKFWLLWSKCGYLWPRKVSLWPQKCCGFQTQWTKPMEGCKLSLCDLYLVSRWAIWQPYCYGHRLQLITSVLSNYLASGYDKLWLPLAVNSHSVSSQMLRSPWLFRCCVLWPQGTMAASGQLTASLSPSQMLWPLTTVNQVFLVWFHVIIRQAARRGELVVARGSGRAIGWRNRTWFIIAVGG